MNTSTNMSGTDADESLANLALALGLVGLLPIPGIVAAVGAIVCGRRASRQVGPHAGRARAGMWLGVIEVAAPLVFLFVYCVVLGYPFPIRRYHP